MSHAVGAVRFPDGLVMFWEHNGTGDSIIPSLWDTAADVWAHWRGESWNACTCGQSEPVELYTTYGGGSTYDGKACRHCRAITSSLDLVEQSSRDNNPVWIHGLDFTASMT